MKKVFLFITCVLLILFLMDSLLGICCKYYIKNHQLTGRYKPLDRLIKNVDTDIILIGNSAILNSVDPEIIEDSLSLTCYNGGIMGQGIDFSETIIDCILQRHTPKMMILGLRPEEMGNKIGEGIYDVLKPYYKLGYTSIDDHFNHSDGLERLLLHSNLIRYNTIWVRVLLYMLFDNTNYQNNGFMPKEVPLTLPELKKVPLCEKPVDKKEKCIERIVRKCKEKDIRLIICFPPTLLMFEQDTIPCAKVIHNLCERNGITCIIDYNNQCFYRHPELFYDDEHVNKKGANIYSQIIAGKIKDTFATEKR